MAIDTAFSHLRSLVADVVERARPSFCGGFHFASILWGSVFLGLVLERGRLREFSSAAAGRRELWAIQEKVESRVQRFYLCTCPFRREDVDRRRKASM